MKRNFLEEFGLEKDVIDRIMKENGKDIEQAKKEMAALEQAKNEMAALEQERDALKKAVEERDRQLEDLKETSGDIDALKEQITQLQAENQTQAETFAAENKAIRISAAVEQALTAAQAKNVKAVKALLGGLENADFNEDGSVKGLAKQIQALKEDPATQFLFQSEEPPVFRGMKPADGGDPRPQGITREQFEKMGYKARVKLFQEDRDTYDRLVGES